MSRYRKFDHDFRAGAVRIVFDAGKPIAEVARGLGVNAGTLECAAYNCPIAAASRAACERIGIKQSMGRLGSALDNAVIESSTL
jgi:transposase InsO family protein